MFACIFFVIAGIVAYIEGKNEAKLYTTNTQNNNSSVHYFGDENSNQPQYTMPQNNQSFDKKLLAIPVVAVIVVVSILLLSSGNITNEPSLNVSNIAIESEGYSMYKVSCDLIPNREYKYLGLVVIFYDASGSEIGKSPLVWNINNPTKGQMIKVSGTALTNDAKMKPTRAELFFYDTAFNSDSSKSIYSVNVTIN